MPRTGETPLEAASGLPCSTELDSTLEMSGCHDLDGFTTLSHNGPRVQDAPTRSKHCLTQNGKVDQSTSTPPTGVEESCRDQVAVSRRTRLRTKTSARDTCYPEAPEQQSSTSEEEQEERRHRLKYVPGPIGALRDQAEIVGLSLAAGPNGDLELQREGRRPIPLTGWGKKAWSQMVRSHINDDMVRDLYNDVKPEQNDDGSQVPPRRKDMVWITPHVDRMATFALLQDKLHDLPKEVKQMLR